jgi:hypothetical protein
MGGGIGSAGVRLGTGDRGSDFGSEFGSDFTLSIMAFRCQSRSKGRRMKHFPSLAHRRIVRSPNHLSMPQRRDR